MAALCIILGVVSFRGPVAHWREARQQRREAERRRDYQFPLELTTDAADYSRYSLVRFTLRTCTSQGAPDLLPSPPRLLVYHRGKIVETIGGLTQLTPALDPSRKTYVCRWPVPWNCPPGVYTAEVRSRMRDPATWPWETPEEELRRRRQERGKRKQDRDIAGEGTCVARVYFTVKARQPAEVADGLCAATWEENLPEAGTRIVGPSGRVGDWRAIYDWCEFIGADCLWVRGAITDASAMNLTLSQPFVPHNIEAIPAMAAEAKRRGLKLGAWAAAFATLPDDDPDSNRRKPPYQFSKDISRSTGKISDTTFISFLDSRRADHLAAFFAGLQADPNVDFLGLDYMRTEPGYELTDRFAREMPVKLPRGWAAMDRPARWKYVAQRAENQRTDEDRAFFDAWNWYRAHFGAEIFQRIVTKSGATKPTWIFSLSWQHGAQHGQDPLMFTDAGATMLCPMLYQIDVARFPFIIRDWRRYLRAGQANIVCGDQVDNRWHQRLGPGELYRRMTVAHTRLIPDGRTQGGFWHDISRAAGGGNLGPYSGVEWALAGGAAFSQIRESWRVYPIRAALQAPPDGAPGEPLGLELTLENRCERTVRGIRVQPYAGGKLKYDSTEPYAVSELKRGEKLLIPFPARISGHDAARNDRHMAAFRITWPEAEYGEQVRKDLPRVIIVVAYVKCR